MLQADGVARGEVPLLDAVGIAVGAAVALALDVAVDGDVQVVLAPGVVPCGKDIADVLDALVHGRLGDLVLLRLGVQRLRLGLGVGEGVAAADGDTAGDEELHGGADAAERGAVDVVALADGLPAFVAQGGEVGVGQNLLVGHHAVVDHVADFVEETADADAHPFVAVLGIDVEEMVLLGLQVGVVERVAHGGLGLVGGIHLRECGRAVATGIAGAQAEAIDVEEETCIGREGGTEVVVLRVAHAGDGIQESEDANLVLREEVVGVGACAVDVVALAGEALLHELGAGGELVPGGQTEDAAQRLVGVVGALAGLVVGLRVGGLPVVVLRGEVVAIDIEIEVDAAVGRPTRTAAVGVGLVVQVVGVGLLLGVGVGGFLGLLVGGLLLGEVGGGLRAVCEVVVVGAAQIDGPLVVEAPFQTFADVVAVEASGHGTARELEHLLVALLELLVVVHLPVGGLVVGVFRAAGELAGIDIHGHVLVEAPVVQHASAGGDADGRLGVVGDDVDDASDGIRAVERRGGTAEDLDALDILQADAVPAVVAADALAVLEDDDVVIADAVEVHEGAHAVGVRGHIGGELRQGVLQRRDLRVLNLLGRDDLHRHGGVVGAVVGAGAGDDDGVQRGLADGVLLGADLCGRNNK